MGKLTPEALRDWRRAHGLSQTTAAAAAGVHMRSWQRWELGERAIPHWLIPYLRQQFGVAPRERAVEAVATEAR